MSCIFEYKGKEFSTKKELLSYFQKNNISKVNLKRDVTFKTTNEFTTMQQKEVTNTLAFAVSQYLKVDQESANVGDYAELIEAYAVDKLKNLPKNSVFKERFEKVAGMSEFFAEEVRKFYADKGIKSVEELKEDANGNLFIENSLLVDPSEKATAKIRSLVSLIPAYTLNQKGNPALDTNTFLGTARFVEEGAMWNDLKIALADIHDPTMKKITDRLDEKGVKKPHLRVLSRMLTGKKANPITGEERFDETLRTQFFNTFALARIDYTSLLIKETAEGVDVRISNTDPSSQEFMLMDQWISRFNQRNTHLKNGEFIYKNPALKNIITTYGEVLGNIQELKKTEKTKLGSDQVKLASPAKTQEVKQQTLDLLEMMGIVMTIPGLDNLLRDFKPKSGSEVAALIKLFSGQGIQFLVERVQDIQKKTEQGIVKMTIEEDSNPLADSRSILRKMAVKQGEMTVDLAETNSLGAEGNLYSNYGEHNLVTQTINALNQNRDATIATIESEIFGNNSNILNWLKESKDNEITFSILNNYKTLNAGDQGSKMSNLGLTDSLVASLNVTLQSANTANYMGLAEADKSRQVVVKGGKFLFAGVKYDPTQSELKKKYKLLNNNATNTLVGYFADELARMRLIYENMHGEGEQKLSPEKWDVNIHKNENLLRSFLFPKFNEKLKNGRTLFETLGLTEVVEINGKPTPIPLEVNRDTIFENSALRSVIEKSFLQAVESDLIELTREGLLEFEKGEYKNVAIDNNILADRYKGDVVTAIGDYTLNSIVGNIEFSKLFTGDPASFKVKELKEADIKKGKKLDVFEDFRKRIPLIIAGGTMSRVYTDKNTGEVAVKATYNSAVVDSIEAPSDYFFEKVGEDKYILNSKVIDNMLEAINAGVSPKEKMTRDAVEAMVKGYRKVNTADAQAWITLPMYKQRMLSWGKWTDAHEDAYKRINEGEITPNEVKMFAQPLKTVHVEPKNVGGHGVRHYLKQSEAVVIPGLFPQLDAMIANNPEVDHFVTIDGKKVGASGVGTINDGNKFKNDKLNYVQLQNKYAYLQQDLPTKQIKDTLVGSQVVKNLLGNILAKGTYEVKGYGEMTGEKLVNDYHTVISELSSIEAQALTEEFGFNEETGSIDEDTFNEYLNRSLEDELTNSEKEMLAAGMPIDAFPHLREKMENKLMAAVLKSTVKLKQLGGAMVQMSAFGTVNDTIKLTDPVGNGIIMLKDNPMEELKPMQLVKEGDVLKTTKAQVFLPHSVVKALLGPDYKSLSHKELKEKLTPDILTGISYRIPNQATSSNDVFEIAGILPAEMGDTIIAYNEITAKTGSDFDIDKAFVILPNVEIREGKVVRPKYAYEMSDKEAYEEKVKKDYLKGVKARKIYKEIEEELLYSTPGLAETKASARANINTLKGKLKADQEIRDNLPTLDENVEEFTAQDVVNILEDTLRALSSNLNEYGELMPDALTEREKSILKKRVKAEYETLKEVNTQIENAVKERLIAEKLMPTFEQFQAYDALKKHTKAALQNVRLDLMQTLLGDPKTYPAAMATLDNPLLENEAKDLYGSGTESSSNLGFFRGTTQTRNKVLFDQAKALVGVIANHMSDQKLSEAELMTYTGINFGRGVTKNGESMVSAVRDENGNFVSTWLNLYMNAIVDAAKDPYIVAANLNQYTAPVTFALVRAGIDLKWVNAFIGQPSIKSLVRGKDISESKIAKRKYDKAGRLITPEKKLIEYYEKKTGIKYEDMVKEALPNIQKLTTAALKKNAKANPLKRDFELEYRALASFLLLKDVSKELSSSIRVSKADVSIGKNLTEAYIKEINMVQALDSGAIRGLNKKLGISPELNVDAYDESGFLNITEDRIAGTFHKHGVQLAMKMFNSKTLNSSNAFKSSLFNIVLDLNPDLVSNSRVLDKVTRELYAYTAAMPGSNITDGDIKGLFYGEDSLARRIARIELRDKDFFRSNLLLSDMTLVHSGEVTSPDFVNLRNKNQDRELYQQAWRDLAVKYPEISEDLFKYAYHGSGFAKGVYTFHHAIPTEMFSDKNFSFFMDAVKIASNNPTFLENATETVIKHMWDNKQLIKTVSKVDIMALEKGLPTSQAFFLKDDAAFKIGKNSNEQHETARYVRNANGELFKLEGYAIPNSVLNEKGERIPGTKEHALYKRVDKLGYNYKGSIVKEYTPSAIEAVPTSMFKENLVSLDEKTLDIIESYKADMRGTSPITGKVSDAIKTNISRSKVTVSESEITEAIKICKGI